MSVYDLPQSLFLLLLAGLFFLPSFIAAKKRHPNRIRIFVLNLMFGWSGTGWIFALLWALISPRTYSPQESDSN